jgi:hypothetical protein
VPKDQSRQTRTVPTKSLDPDAHRLILEAGASGARLIIVDDDGRTVAEVHGATSAKDPDLWRNYDPNAARSAWRAAAGSMRSTEIEEMLADLKAERGQGRDDQSSF